MSKYYVVREPDAGDIFGSIMAFLVVLFIIVAVAATISFYILLGFLGIGVLIGMVYAIYAYVKGFINACKTLGGVGGRNGLTALLLKWWVLFKNASVFVIKEIFNIARNAIVKSSAFKVLSFRKWMWLIVAPSVVVCGLSMVIVVAFLQIGMVFSIIGLVLTLLAATALVYLLVSLVYAIIKVGGGFISCLKNSNPFTAFDFSRYFTFSDTGRVSGDYFRYLFTAIKDIWNEAISLMTYNFSSAKGYPIVNVIRYFLFVSPIAIFLVMGIFIAIVFVVLSIVFVPVLLAQLVWGVIRAIFIR